MSPLPHGPRARTWAALPVLLAVLAACGSNPTLDDVAAEDAGFSDCVEAAGVSLEGSGDWDADRAQAFWKAPGTLDCALDELDAAARRDALAGAFPELDDDTGDRSTALPAQWQVVIDWTRRSAEDRSLEQVVSRLTALLADTWVSDSDFGATNGMVSAGVLGAMRGAGELPSFDTYLRDHPDAEDDASVLVGFAAGSSIDHDEQSRFFALNDDAVDDVRG